MSHLQHNTYEVRLLQEMHQNGQAQLQQHINLSWIHPLQQEKRLESRSGCACMRRCQRSPHLLPLMLPMSVPAKHGLGKSSRTQSQLKDKGLAPCSGKAQDNICHLCWLWLRLHHAHDACAGWRRMCMHAHAQHKGVVRLCAHSDCACMHIYICAGQERRKGILCYVLTLTAHACMRRTATAQGDIVLCADSECTCMHAQDSKRRGICAVCWL